MKANPFLTMMILATFAGCLPDPIPVGKMPKLEPKIVISSQMLPDRGLAVTVSKSIGALEAGEDSDVQELLDQILIDDALVTLHYQGRIDTLTSLGNGVYGDVEPAWMMNVPYTLHVRTEELGEVTATTELTQRVTIESASLELQPIPEDDDSLVHVNFTFDDPAGKNYYIMSLQEYSTTHSSSDYLDPRIFNRLEEDTNFDGQRHSGNFNVIWPRFHAGDTVALFLSTVSKEYYHFLQVQKENNFSLVEFISEPLNYPTNVNGGYGFFNLRLPDVRIYVLEE